MYLKSLVLKGFKSFADRSVLKLEPGMTVVVGPNGSGKSNIADAVLWVLGEQSAKQLRGQAMEDVIFAGSSARQAVGLAEVDLVLDNSDGTLPLDFTEVVITRRMYRSGESEYLINGTQSRLMDVQDVLNDCGLGRDTHSIISQGSLANVLRARPEDRRVLIEEAAGILKHKKRKERSSRKLKSMDEQLTRVADVAREIDRQLKPLERQASRAKRHEELSAQLRDVQLVLAVDDLRALQAAWAVQEKAEHEADAQAELLRYRLQERQAELEKYQRLLEEKGLFVGDLAEQRTRCQSVLERLDAGMLLLEEKGRNMVTRLSELRQTIHRSDSRQAEVAAQLESHEEEHRSTLAQRDELAQQLQQQQDQARQLAEQRGQADTQVSGLSAELRGCERELDEATLAALKAKESLSTANTEDGLLAQRLGQIDEGLAATRATLAARRSRLAELDEQLAKLQRESKLAKADIDKRVRLQEAARKKLDAAREELASLQAELKGLRDVDRAVDDASPMLAWSMQRKDSIEGLVAPLSEVFSAPPELEHLVEHLLGSDMFGLLMQDAAAAGALAQQLLDGDVDGGEMSLVALEGRTARRVRARAGTSLLEQLSYDEQHARVAELLLGDVYVVDGVEQAIEAAQADESGARFVTPQGVVAWPNGKVTVGTHTADAEGVLGRKRRINALAEQEPAAQQAADEAQQQLAAAQKRLHMAQADDFDISQSIAQVSGERDSLREEAGRLEQSITASAQEREQVAQRRAKLAQSSASAREGLAQLQGQQAELEQRKAALSEQVAAAREQRTQLLSREDAANRGISATKVDLATAREREVHLARRIASLQQERERLAASLAVSHETEQSMEILRLRVEPLYAVFQELRDGVRAKAQVLRDRAHLEQAGQGDLRDTIEQARAGVREANAQLDAANAKLTDVRIEKSRLEVQVEQAMRVITEENGVLLDVALQAPAPENREELEEQAQALGRKLKNIGAVNPVAVEEYRKLKERRDFISVQLDDLEGARKALERIVAAIDRKMRNRFLDTFEQVNANFEEVFAQLFPGGQGHLELTDPAHPEETGVEVHAQPRGKAVRKQTLLSGGEQSLVAMALMFSVYKVRRTPFYILDEVEAALDDTNLRRLLAYLDGIRTSTQFIIISHQRRTMEMADLLYGVSMRGDGVSKLVSQKLDQAIRLAGSGTGEPRDVESFSGAQ